MIQLAADLIQHLAVSGHRLEQILNKSVFIIQIPPKLSIKSFIFSVGHVLLAEVSVYNQPVQK